ncbi:MAG: PAS domain S-box protein [Holophagales bacterium]|nr:PAS domain S-box protein [Holophagales bacterium]
MKILAIDDNPDNLTTLQAVLSDRLPEARFLTALSGPQGLELARAKDPDVILLDIVMPGLDGYAVCRQLKEDDRLRSIPVLFLTAHKTGREARVKALEAGAEGFLSQPFDEVELSAQIQAMTRIKAANRMQRLEREELEALVAERTRGLELELAARKRAEAALRESEASVRKKLEAIVAPEGDLGTLELADIIDTQALQSLMEDFYRATGMLGAVLDTSGRVLVAVGWQDICTKFHRCHPDTLRNCTESDTVLTQGVPPGTFRAYHCKNHLWDMVTPLLIGDRHVGNVFIGQFFYEGEKPDRELFREAARRHGFDETEYLAALDRVPRFSREAAQACMQFYVDLAGIIARLGYGAIQQSRMLTERKRAEEALRLKDVVFRSSIAANSIADTRGRITAANDAFLDTWGYESEDDVLGRPIGGFFQNEAEAVAVLKALDTTGEWAGEYVARRKDGSTFVAMSLATVLRNEANEVVGYQSSVADVSERKRAEREAAVRAVVTELFRQGAPLETTCQRITESLVATLEFPIAAIELHDVQQGEMVFLGVAGVPELRAGERIPAHQTLSGAVATTGEVLCETRAGQRPEPRFETLRQLELETFVGVPLRVDEEVLGTLVLADRRSREDASLWVPALQAIAVQLTLEMKRRRAEEALRESEEKHRLLIEHSHDIIYTIDSAGVLTFVSQAWTTLLGHPVSRVVGRGFDSFVHPENVPACRLWLQRVIETGQRQAGIEYRVRHDDGTWRWHTSSAVPLKGEAGAIAGFEGIARDITERKLAEEAVNREQAFSKAVVESIPGAFYVLDERGRYARWNAYQREEIIGRPEGEIAGFSALETIHPEDRERVQERIVNVMKNGADETVEGRVLLRGGPGFRWLLMTGRRMLVNGHPFLVGIGVDITERKEAEAAVRESRQRLEFALQGGNLGVWDWFPETGAVTYGDTWADLLGYRPEEIEPTVDFFRQHVHPDDLPAVLERLTDHVEGRLPEYRSEHRLRTRSGSWKWVLDCGRIADTDEDGRVVRVTGVVSDVSKRKQAEEARQKFVLLADSSSEFIGICDLDLTPVYVNPAGIRMVGLSDLTTACRLKVQDYFFPEDQRFIQDEFFPRVLREGHGTVEIRLRNFQTGEPIWMVYYLFHLRDASGALVGWATVSRDITDRKRAEAKVQQQLDELLRWQAVMLDREDRVRALKREVNDLSRRLGGPARYPSQEAGAASSGVANEKP